MKFHAMFWPLAFCAFAAAASPIEEPPNPPSILPGNIYMAGSTGDHSADSGVAATSISVGLTSEYGDS